MTSFKPNQILILLFLAILLSSPFVEAKPPNIIVILTDDLNNEVLSHEAKIKKYITDRGMRFDNHFVSLSLCCPSRVATLRGQYAHNTGIYNNAGTFGGFETVFRKHLESSTVATWLQAAGYRTGLLGKYLNGYPSLSSGKHYIPPGWSYWFSPIGGSPYSEYNYSISLNGFEIAYGAKPDDYMVDVLSQTAASFINLSITFFYDKPFFLFVAPYAPHEPATPAVRYLSSFPGVKAPRTPSFNEADVSDKPLWVRKRNLLSPSEINNIDALYRKRLQSMLAVGDLVENIVKTLESRGQLNNTYIFFTSDNGFHQGQHRLASGKNTGYEPDLRIPLVVRGPGIPAGSVVKEMTANVDLAPTLAAIARTQPPSFVDGRSLTPLLSGTHPPKWRQALLLEHGGPSITNFSANGLLETQDPFDLQTIKTGLFGPPIFHGLITKNLAILPYGPINYIEYSSGGHELYDLSTDPDQLSNSYRKAPPSLKTKLSTRIKQLRNAKGQELRNIEEAPL